MANEEHLALLKRDVVQWNQFREQHPDIRPDFYEATLYEDHLHGADLYKADLRGANLNRANLAGANLNHANLYRADLGEANLTDACLTGADLSYANLTGANLSNANLAKASLNAANLKGICLVSAHLQGAIVWETIFTQIDLSQVKGLAELDHQGPSCVELQTIRLPQDGSALHFLRGVGVSDEWIDFYRSTIMRPIEYHSCFISYSSNDEILARRLHADLQAQGVRCWFAVEDLKIGEKFRARIDEAIHLQDKLLLLLSEHSLTSNWVEVEVEAALEKEHNQQREVLFPVRLDESVMQTEQAWAKQLRRSRHIGDFICWTDPQAYKQAFERLLRDLKQTSK